MDPWHQVWVAKVSYLASSYFFGSVSLILAATACSAPTSRDASRQIQREIEDSECVCQPLR